MKKKLSFLYYSIRINLIITGFVFLLLLLTNLISDGFFSILHPDLVPPEEPGGAASPFLFHNAVFCILVGSFLTFISSHWLLSPIRKIIRGIRDVSEGNFQTKLHLNHPKEFRTLSLQFNRMTEELSGIEMLRSDFVNNFSHEFKTPIVSILGFAKLLKQEDLTRKEREEYLDIIIEESNRLVSLSSGVLTLSKLENTALLPDVETYNVSEQIRLAVAQLSGKWMEKDLSFQMELEELSLAGNRDLLKEVWLNLLDNAIKFSPAHSVITVSAQKTESSAVFSIRDQGCGILPEAMKHIYDKFYQGDTSHAVQGNGLGLPLVKRILELHQGTIQVQSAPKNGSVFSVTLPLK